jgi:hypothetical protein
VESPYEPTAEAAITKMSFSINTLFEGTCIFPPSISVTDSIPLLKKMQKEKGSACARPLKK